jgi:hypothetical protein
LGILVLMQPKDDCKDICLPGHYLSQLLYSGEGEGSDEGRKVNYHYNKGAKVLDRMAIPGVKSLFHTFKTYFTLNIGSSHWVGVIVDIVNEEILWLDSLLDKLVARKFMALILEQLLPDELKSRKREHKQYNPKKPFKEWTQKFAEVPQQPGVTDCGMYALLFLHYKWAGMNLTPSTFGSTDEEKKDFINNERKKLFTKFLQYGRNIHQGV